LLQVLGLWFIFPLHEVVVTFNSPCFPHKSLLPCIENDFEKITGKLGIVGG